MYEDGDTEDYTLADLNSILIDKDGNTNPIAPTPPRTSPRLRQTYMAESVPDPTTHDNLQPETTTDFHNLVRHSFTHNRRISYAAKKHRTDNNPTITQAKRSVSWEQWKIAILNEFKNLTDKNTYTICWNPYIRLEYQVYILYSFLIYQCSNYICYIIILTTYANCNRFIIINHCDINYFPKLSLPKTGLPIHLFFPLPLFVHFTNEVKLTSFAYTYTNY